MDYSATYIARLQEELLRFSLNPEREYMEMLSSGTPSEAYEEYIVANHGCGEYFKCRRDRFRSYMDELLEEGRWHLTDGIVVHGHITPKDVIKIGCSSYNLVIVNHDEQVQLRTPFNPDDEKELKSACGISKKHITQELEILI